MTATTWNETPVAIRTDEAELRRTEIGGDLSVALIRLVKGADMGPALKGLPDDMCPCPHWGYLLKGRLRLRTGAGPEAYEVYEEGQAFYWPPGHVPEALEDCEFVDFSPTEEFDRVISHINAQG
ncbi:hypothetical protein C5F59_019920 [Streptomyces sp. QL37]|uniref:hypothetical protein n=1 Tax=Streptomyces sp. QL37 TaxID=2093747 RepID=UPI000CF222CD|nr:hypothetical protein [Streptomyces sp. QL37]PPQ58462.1 hypothetical protein C5F59_18600 [Streptomyces sp. QL37]